MSGQTNYEVRMSDSVENTGLDCQVFASLDEAQRAADVVNSANPAAHAEVSETNMPVTLTFREWNERGW
jgi:hypothetical protein